MAEGLTDKQIDHLLTIYENRINSFGKALADLREDYEQLVTQIRQKEATLGPSGRRDVYAAPDQGVGAEGAGPATDAAPNSADRGGAQNRSAGGAEEGALAAEIRVHGEFGMKKSPLVDWEDHLLSNSLSPLYKKEDIRREYAAMLRTLADKVERLGEMPSVIIVGLSFHPTSDCSKIEMYTFTSHGQYLKMAPFIWRKWGVDENDK